VRAYCQVRFERVIPGGSILQSVESSIREFLSILYSVLETILRSVYECSFKPLLDVFRKAGWVYIIKCNLKHHAEHTWECK
jgi:hypothetical protein